MKVFKHVTCTRERFSGDSKCSCKMQNTQIELERENPEFPQTLALLPLIQQNFNIDIDRRRPRVDPSAKRGRDDATNSWHSVIWSLCIDCFSRLIDGSSWWVRARRLASSRCRRCEPDTPASAIYWIKREAVTLILMPERESLSERADGEKTDWLVECKSAIEDLADSKRSTPQSDRRAAFKISKVNHCFTPFSLSLNLGPLRETSVSQKLGSPACRMFCTSLYFANT